MTSLVASPKAVVALERIEVSKENVQPSRRGHEPHKLVQALSTSDASSSTDAACASLASQRSAHEQSILSYSGSDPLTVWLPYIHWTLSSFPSLSSSSHLLPLLEKCTRTLLPLPQYRQDRRYVAVWLLYAERCAAPGDVFSFMDGQGVGSRVSALYVEWSRWQEKMGRLEQADALLQRGIDMLAQPQDTLRLARKASATDEAAAAFCCAGQVNSCRLMLLSCAPAVVSQTDSAQHRSSAAAASGSGCGRALPAACSGLPRHDRRSGASGPERDTIRTAGEPEPSTAAAAAVQPASASALSSRTAVVLVLFFLPHLFRLRLVLGCHCGLRRCGAVAATAKRCGRRQGEREGGVHVARGRANRSHDGCGAGGERGEGTRQLSGLSVRVSG